MMIFTRILLSTLLLTASYYISAGVDLLIYDEGFQWASSRQEINRRLDMVSRTGATVYAPSIWLGDGTPYPSNISPISVRMNGADPTWDPARYLLAEAEKRGIEIWPNVLINRRQPSRYAQLRKTARDKKLIFDELSVSSFSNDYFDIRDNKYQEFIYSVLQEYVVRYKPKRLILDYIRTGGICLSESCTQEYKKTYNRKLEIDQYIYKHNAEAREALTRWQHEPIYALIKRIHNLVPDGLKLVTTTSPHDPDSIDNVQGRHTHKWLREGIVEQALVMDYSNNPRYELVARNNKVGLKEDILIGIYKVEKGNMVPISRSELTTRLQHAQELLDTGNGKVLIGVYLMNLLTEDHVDVLADFIK